MLPQRACSTPNYTYLLHFFTQELFTPNSPHIRLGLNGVEVIGNGSGSHHQLRKLHQRVELMKSATAKNGGIYLYANQQGCDGNRLYFDGAALIFCNGHCLAQGTQFSLSDVEVITASVDLEEVRAYRGGINSRGLQASLSANVERLHSNWRLASHEWNEPSQVAPSLPVGLHYLTPQEEICYGMVALGMEPFFALLFLLLSLFLFLFFDCSTPLFCELSPLPFPFLSSFLEFRFWCAGPACWLWDYLRRSGMGGFFLPLSGGADR